MEEDQKIRIAKLIAQRGVASRREAETLIEEGRVKLNGRAISEQVLVDPENDIVHVDGEPLPEEPPKVYYLLYKPKGYITGRNDPRGRRSVLELAKDLRYRVEPVGRLDFDTEGALILTNDGELANRLLRPANAVPKRYMAKVYRTPDDKDLWKIRNGKVFLEDGAALPAKCRVVEQTDTDNSWVEITVTEGRNRLIRRLFAQLGHPVAKLRRESFATISLRDLERGQLRPLTREEVKRLQDLSQGITPKRAGKPSRGKGFAKPKIKNNRKPKRTKHAKRV